MALYAFTSSTLNYIPKARLLARSLKRHHPEIRFHLLLAEMNADGLLSDDEPFDKVSYLGELGFGDALNAWVFRHSLIEVCTAIKGPYADLLLGQQDCEGVLYFDPDIAVLGRLDGLLDSFRDASILLTPHQTEPEETHEAVMDNELCCLRHGVFNLGFLAVKASDEGRKFVRWWRRRLESFCYWDIKEGLFTDQKWVDLAPALFSEVSIIRDPAYNVATWNLTHRTVTGQAPDALLVNGKPLAFYHFSGFDNGSQLTMLFKYGKTMPALFELRDWYIRECARAGQKEFGELKWSFSKFDNGEPIRDEQRKLYRQRSDLQQAFPNPFCTADATRSFYHWYRTYAT